ncbi:MAG: M14 family metallopeptidase, partial [bacterium]
MSIKTTIVFLFAFGCNQLVAQQQFVTKFEMSGGTETATYAEGIEFYSNLADSFDEIKMTAHGKTDSGKPLHLVTLSVDRDFDVANLRQKNKRILLINNAIHPGEPDGVDASMMFLRDLVQNKAKYQQDLEKVVIAIIPFYNIGGVLNRNSTSRVNQNGPKAYGFRGNARNYDLNRDFIKNDTRNARSFAQIFHLLDPDIFVDTHVSNGADYQYVITMDIAQKDKLGGVLAGYLENTMMPSLFERMKNAGAEMIPYVNVYGTTPDQGYSQFFDSPRYSSGYTVLFHTIGFMSETHMLKPYRDRVRATYSYLHGILKVMSRDSDLIKRLREETKEAVKSQKRFPITWKLDRSRYTELKFKGYEALQVDSKVTGQKRLLYDHSRPFEKTIPYYNHYVPDIVIEKPEYYVIPQGWHHILDRLRLNQVHMRKIGQDTTFAVEVYYIEDYKTRERHFEGHYMHYDVKLRKERQTQSFAKGDYLVPVNQWVNRYIVETLEPQGVDSFFTWNLFDTILQRKEGFSSYVFEDLAERLLSEDAGLRARFEQKRTE